MFCWSMYQESILSHNAVKMLLGFRNKTHWIIKLKRVGIETIFALASSISYQIVNIGDTNGDGCMLTGTDEQVALASNED